MRILLGSFLLGLLSHSALSQECKFAPRDHQDFGNALANWNKQRGKKDEFKALEALQAVLARVGKPVGGKDELKSMQAALRLTADLQKGAYASLQFKGVKAEEVVKSDVPTAKPYQYAVRAPKGYKPSGGPYPLLIAVPDMKNGKPTPPDQFLAAELLSAELRDQYILVAVPMPEDGTLWNQNRSEKGETGVGLVMRSLADVRTNFAVDYDRVYLLGHGAGVETCFVVGSMFPHLFAGVAGRAGDTGAADWRNFRSLPTLIFAGGAKASAFDEQSRAAGYDSCTLKSEVKPEAVESELAAWMGKHPRTPYPTKVSLFPGSPIPSRAYWVEVPPKESEPGTVVHAEVDRATNTFQITTKGVDRVTLYLNDVLCDLDKPLKVVINGQAQETLVPRSLETLLELLVKNVCDPARVYVAARAFNVPG